MVLSPEEREERMARIQQETEAARLDVEQLTKRLMNVLADIRHVRQPKPDSHAP